MNKTLGDLIDRLSVTNCKLYAIQDKVHSAARNGEGLDPETVQKLMALNLDRNRTMTAIDETFAQAVQSGRADVDPRVKVV